MTTCFKSQNGRVMNKVSLDTLADVACLKSAWAVVKSKGAAGGIDSVSIDDYSASLEKNLADLASRLSERSWKPQPYQLYNVKKAKGGVRIIGQMTVEDKIVQHALKSIIEPCLDKSFSSSSYAYRPGKGHAKAVRRTWAECTKKINRYFLRLDIDNFFDTIDRGILFSKLRKVIKDEDICRYVELSMTMGRVNEKMEWVEMERGIPQGAVLSPLLANLYLNSFDQSVLSKTSSYVRYSDDFVVLCSSEAVAVELRTHIESYLNNKLKLKLNDSPATGLISEGFTFLGLTLSKTEISVSDLKLKELEEKIARIEVKEGQLSEHYVESLDGIRIYYSKLLPAKYASLFDLCLKNAISAWIEANPEIAHKDIQKIFMRIQPFGAENNICKWLKEFEIQPFSVADSSQSLNKKLIRSRKLEYQRREADNSELVITSPGYFIGVSNRGVTLRKNGQPLKVPPSTALKHITIMSDGVSMSTNMISFCMSQGIPIDLFDRHCTHIASILSPKFMLTTLWKMQEAMDVNAKGEIAQKIISGKVKNQLNLCKYFNKYHKNVGQSSTFDVFIQGVEQLLESIKSLPPKECTGKTLMPLEAHAADLYWNYIKGLVEDDGVEFYSRVKQGAKDVVNSMLNYGYSLLYPRIWQALLKKRLNPYIGFVHYADGNPNLVFDVIELFRSQAVDRVVISMIQKGEPLHVDANGMLAENTRNSLAKHILERLHRYEKYRGVQLKFIDIINCQVEELADSIITGTNYRPYLAKW